MPPRIVQERPKPHARSTSKGYDSDSSGSTLSTPYQWSDLLNPDLSPMDFDAVLMGVLRSTTEMERIQGLDEPEFQSVIDVLGEYVRTEDVMNGLQKRCFKSLCRLCATRGVLPRPYTLNYGDLQRSEVPDYSGAFGEVWRGSYNGTTVAIKKLRGVTALQLEKKKERFCHEVVIWKRLSNLNTLPLIGAYMHGPELVMVSEWMSNGDVKQYVQRNPRVNKFSLLADVARGTIYLHSMNIVHGDLKGVNILVKDDGKACLADFGLMSIVLDPEITDITTSTSEVAKGTFRWMSPELFYPAEFGLKFQLTKKSDCYAFGMVIYEVLSGKIPLEEIKQQWQVPLAVFRGKRPGIPDRVTPRMMELWKIAQECWSPSPRDRPSFPSILDKLSTFASLEDVTPFELREPKPLRVIGEPPHLLLLIVILKSAFIRTKNRNYGGMAGTVNRGLFLDNATGYHYIIPIVQHVHPPFTNPGNCQS
ncbi:kinase-like protein [Thelephora ganbajun]|uniref:Kinase-like protein n=1 Tax=Thelephora ganbajun TaxID=370292 RepID=A0ACB6Z3U1_THEGA|nr:kinase-like protein [Thelephora ganbajun]